MLVTFISDTHLRHNDYPLSEGDVVVHSGDADINTKEQCIDFVSWLGSRTYDLKIYVPGNHDGYIYYYTEECFNIFEDYGIKLLIEDSIDYKGYKFYGSPYTPTFGDWYYMEKPEHLKNRWKNIPRDTDILITHGPPKYLLDNPGRGHAGCMFLGQAVDQIKPIIHAFGHIHENYGFKNYSEVLYVNAAVCPAYFDSKEKFGWDVTLYGKKVEDIIPCRHTS